MLLIASIFGPSTQAALLSFSAIRNSAVGLSPQSERETCITLNPRPPSFFIQPLSTSLSVSTGSLFQASHASFAQSEDIMTGAASTGAASAVAATSVASVKLRMLVPFDLPHERRRGTSIVDPRVLQSDRRHTSGVILAPRDPAQSRRRDAMPHAFASSPCAWITSAAYATYTFDEQLGRARCRALTTTTHCARVSRALAPWDPAGDRPPVDFRTPHTAGGSATNGGDNAKHPDCPPQRCADVHIAGRYRCCGRAAHVRRELRQQREPLLARIAVPWLRTSVDTDRSRRRDHCPR